MAAQEGVNVTNPQVYNGCST